jgi:hypothetical protein
VDYFFGFVDVTLLKTPKNGLKIGKNMILFSEELKFYVKLGFVFKINYFFKFTKIKLFNTFVEHFYCLKKYTINKIIKYFSKICLNSLYGKFMLNNKKSLIHITSSVNSYAKLEMYQYRLINYIYSDVDSILYNFKLFNKYTGYDIGLLKLINKINYGIFSQNIYIYYNNHKYYVIVRNITRKVNFINQKLEKLKIFKSLKKQSYFNFKITENYYKIKFKKLKKFFYTKNIKKQKDLLTFF